MRRALLVCCLCACGGGPTAANQSVAYQPDSPWPKFRGDAVQDGATSRRLQAGGAFWSFPTGKGIFSSPVVGADGTIYVGSADRTFYAVGPDGTRKWSLLTGEIIDSAGLLDDKGRVYFGSGDGNLRAVDTASGSVVWMTPADPPAMNSALINWFEGNVALAPDGRLWAGNDNFELYGFDREGGAIVSRLRVPDQTWSLPAFDLARGDFFVGNNNLVDFEGSNLFAFHDDGSPLWDLFTGTGTVAASPMITPDGAVIVGGFDGYLRAYEKQSGALRWEFGARDHLYASPARLRDGTIIQASTDGSVYALDPKTGALRWEVDGTDPIRSSPSVDGDGNIYYGGGDGRLWVLGSDGTVRWSMQLIAEDRNDLNSSPALGRDAIYLGGESGEVFSVPFDYCIGSSDPRCAAPPALDTSDGAQLYYTTPFGSQVPSPPSAIDPNQPLVLSLVVRQGGHAILATLDPSAVQVTPAGFDVSVSGDGKFLTLVPSQALAAGPLALSVSAGALINLSRTGLKLSGGTPGGTATLSWTPTVNAPTPSPFPLAGANWELARVALPLPTLLPSYNQIGFDSLHYLIGMVEPSVAWMAGAKLASDENVTEIDPATGALFPLSVDYAGGFATWSNQDGVSVEVMNAVIPFKSFRLSGALGSDGNASGAVRLVGSTLCMGIPIYGLFLEKLGLCNPKTDVLTVSGAANLKTFAAPALAGVGTVTFAATSDAVTATVGGSSLKLAEHACAVLLIDASTGQPVTLDYGLTTTRSADGGGNLATVSIPITGKTVPPMVRAYLMIDTTPAASTTLTIP
jgi:outer membrane protein assembly factor BamB